jgi:hypothetical protein
MTETETKCRRMMHLGGTNHLPRMAHRADHLSA